MLKTIFGLIAIVSLGTSQLLEPLPILSGPPMGTPNPIQIDRSEGMNHEPLLIELYAAQASFQETPFRFDNIRYDPVWNPLLAEPDLAWLRIPGEDSLEPSLAGGGRGPMLSFELSRDDEMFPGGLNSESLARRLSILERQYLILISSIAQDHKNMRERIQVLEAKVNSQ